MSDKKISQLLSGGASQAADEYPIARSGANFKVTGANIAAAATSVGTLTSLTVSGNITASGGTANGVGYLNASKVLTTGTALTFSGSQLEINSLGDQLKLTRTSVGSGTLNVGGSGEIAYAAASHIFYNAAKSTEWMSLNASGNLAVDTNTLYVDAANNRVGVGTASPRGLLHVGADLNNGATDAAAINLKQTSTTAATGIYLERSGERKGYYLYVGGDQDSLTFQYNNAGTKGDTMSLTRDGNVGVGVTPSAWSGIRAIQNRFSSFCSYFDGSPAVSTQVVSNAFYDGSAWKYQQSLGAAIYEQTTASGGAHIWSTAASGTGGNTVTFTERARITSGGAFQITGTLESTGNIGVPNGVQIGLNGLNSATRIYAFGGSGQAMSLDAASINCLYLGAFTSGSVQLPGIGTTASAANAFIDSANSNLVLRSTSSIRYKRDVETLEQEYADNVLALRPVWYRSKAERDNKDWGWYGLIAEEVAAIDPRIVHWGYADEDYEEVVIEQAVAQDGEPEVAPKTERRLKDGAELKPDGVQYERLSVLLLDVVKRQNARIEALEARLEALEA